MTEPFTCPGCHGGDFADFDHFCDVLDVSDDEAPHAFAAWLANTTEWDGDYGKVCEPSYGSTRETGRTMVRSTVKTYLLAAAILVGYVAFVLFCARVLSTKWHPDGGNREHDPERCAECLLEKEGQ